MSDSGKQKSKIVVSYFYNSWKTVKCFEEYAYTIIWEKNERASGK